MALTAEKTSELISEYSTHDGDTGSSEVQVALLTERINMLTGHMRTHKHDFHSRRGLIMMVGKRNRLLRYIEKRDREGYLKLIASLGLRK